MTQKPFIFGDLLPTAPELAAPGSFGVGVRTLKLVNPAQIDVEADGALADRHLMVEVWYPALIPDGVEELTVYQGFMGRQDHEGSLEPIEFPGRALRDAEPNASSSPYPLVVVSHGYPGSRLMMTNLTENLASKGYVVVAIEHTNSTYYDVGNVNITLLNRPLDQRFVIDEMARQNENGGFLNGLLDADNTALIGYSMGGYGVLNMIGAGYNAILSAFMGSSVAPRLAGAEGYAADPRVKTAVLFAPWGGDLTPAGVPGMSVWDDASLGDITIPTLWIVGSEDDVSMYGGVIRLYEHAIHSDRLLLTYANALHNVAPNPAAPQATNLQQYQQMSEPAWDQRHINNVNQHFLTAFLGLNLKRDESMTPYLELAADTGTGIATGTAQTLWQGFQPRTVVGLTFRHDSP